MTQKRIAFIGLGVMGAPMAGHLAKAGHLVTVYNRTKAKSVKWAEINGGKVAGSAAEAAKDAEFVFACVGNDQDLLAVTLASDGAFATMAQEAIFVDHSTVSADLARRLYDEARLRQLHFIDAPVSGGQAGAEQGRLSIMCGGDQEPFAKAYPIGLAYAQVMQLLGGAGSGQLAKMVNQICIAGVLQGLAEAIDFGLKSGLDMVATLAVISKGAASSWQMVNRGETMVQGEFDFGFAVDWMIKDLGLVLQEGDKQQLRLELVRLVKGYYGEVQAMGGGRLDSSSLIKRLVK